MKNIETELTIKIDKTINNAGTTHCLLFSRSVQIFLICVVIFNGTKVSVLGESFVISFWIFSLKE